MLSGFSLCAFLAPALVSALPWDGPNPTGAGAEIDRWSPMPTPAPGILELFKRQNTPGPNTCGYIGGTSSSSLTCLNHQQVCATISSLGVHGCCDEDSLDNCFIATTCVPNSDLSAAPSNLQFVTLCTASTLGECYEWRYDFGSTVMTEHGCASSAFTISVSRTYDGQPSADEITKSSVPEVVVSTQVVTVAPSKTDGSSTNTDLPITNSGGGSSKPKKSNVGAIAGGVVGGLAGLAAIIFAVVFLVLRKKKKSKTSTPATIAGPPAPQNNNYEYKPAPQDPNYPASPYPQQAYPQQVYPQQGYAQPNQGYFDPTKQGYPNPAPGYPNSPYQPSTSPAPGYGQPVPPPQGTPQPQQPVVHQLDSTAIAGPQRHAGSNAVHEAP